jgi:hypothetical protein
MLSLATHEPHFGHKYNVQHLDYKSMDLSEFRRRGGEGRGGNRKGGRGNSRNGYDVTMALPSPFQLFFLLNTNLNELFDFVLLFFFFCGK